MNNCRKCGGGLAYWAPKDTLCSSCNHHAESVALSNGYKAEEEALKAIEKKYECSRAAAEVILKLGK